MPRTRKPCPGCGGTDSNRSADSVCFRCKQDLENWAKYKESLSAESETIHVTLTAYYHWYPMFYFGGDGQQVEELRKTLADGFCKIAPLCCSAIVPWQDGKNPVPMYSKQSVRVQDGSYNGRHISYPASDGNAYSSSGEKVGVMKKETYEILTSLWDATARLAHQAYLSGLEHGRNALLQLASGGISTDKFQERDTQLAREIQDSRILHTELKKRKSKK